MSSDAHPDPASPWDLLVFGDSLVALTTAWSYRRRHPRARIALLAPTPFHDAALLWPQWPTHRLPQRELLALSQSAWRDCRRRQLGDRYGWSLIAPSSADRWVAADGSASCRGTGLPWRSLLAHRLRQQLRRDRFAHLDVHSRAVLKATPTPTIWQDGKPLIARRLCVALTQGLPRLPAFDALDWHSDALPTLRLDRPVCRYPWHTPHGSLWQQQLIGKSPHGPWLATLMATLAPHVPTLRQSLVTRLGQRRRDAFADLWPRCLPFSISSNPATHAAQSWCAVGFAGIELAIAVAVGGQLAAALDGDAPGALLERFLVPVPTSPVRTSIASAAVGDAPVVAPCPR